MTVYVENVLFENMMVDGLILLLVAKTLRQKINWWGIFISSLFGSLFALFSPQFETAFAIMLLIKLFVCVAMAYMLNFQMKKLFSKSMLLFLYTFVFGGMVYALFLFFNIQAKNGFVFQYNSDVPIVGIVVLCFAMFFCLQKGIKKLYARKKINSFLYDVTLFLNNKHVNLKGFLDTGNTLVTKGGKPVVMIPKKLLKSFFNSHECLAFALKKYGAFASLNPQELSVLSIAGQTKITSFDARCQLNKKEMDICVGVYDDHMFFGKGFDAILSPKMLEVSDV